MLGHKCSFPNSHFLDSGRKKQKGRQGLTVKPATAFPEFVYITVTLSYVFVSNCCLNRLNM